MSLVAATGRLADLYRRTTASRSTAVLLASNAIPLVGVLFLDWNLWTVMALFWVENGIIGFWNVPRILLARKPSVFELVISGVLGGVARALQAVFFVIHYGLFWAVHGVFVLVALPSIVGARSGVPLVPEFPADPGGLSGDFPSGIPFFGFGDPGSIAGIVWSAVGIGALGLFLSHGFAFAEWVRERRYLETSPSEQATAPYGRLVVLHVTIIVGAFAIGLLGTPFAALVLLVVLKSALDLGLAFRFQRRRALAPELVVRPG